MMNLPRLPARKPDSHKGNFGRAIIVGGSRGMSGAIALTGMSTLRSGAGLVRLAVPDACLETVAAVEPSYMTSPLPCDGQGRLSFEAREDIAALAENATCIACGPGLARSDELDQLVLWLYRNLQKPMVLDADALNALAAADNGLSSPAGPRIVTPHPGEFRRLARDPDLAASESSERAKQLARECGIVVVLKGHRTLITDGDRSAHNETGNPGMATGGTGDVLTGIITAMVCQGLEPFEAAQLGVHVHGLAGDLAAQDLGQVSLIARDLVDYLPKAFQQITHSYEG